MTRNLIAAVAACAFAAPAISAQGNNFVDGYFVISDIDAGGSDDGDGFGVKGAGQVTDRIFFTGEYQSVEYDDSNADLDQFRLGAGFGPGMGSSGEGIYGRVEYVNVDLDSEDEDGLGGTVGYALPLNKQFRLHGEVGYLYLDDTDGPELLIGGTYRINQNFGIFADYRMSMLETDVGPGDQDVDIDDLRIGARFYF